MRLQELHVLAEKGLHLHEITKDPLTFSAATTLLKAKSSKITQPEQIARDLLLRQMEAYKVLFTTPLP